MKMDIRIDINNLYTISDCTVSPHQASSKHILNALDNDCIQEILRRLNNFEDALNIAETCVKFQTNFCQYFLLMEKVFYLNNDHLYFVSKLKKHFELPTTRMDSF